MARNKRVTGLHPLSYMGVEATTPAQLIESRIDPETSFFKFPIGTEWINVLTNDIWILTNVVGSIGTWTQMTSGNLTNVTDAGNATAVGDEIDLIGSGVLSTSGATNVVTLGMTGASDGQLIIAGTGLDPAWATVTSSDGSITITAGANSLDITRTGDGGATDFVTDAGTATTVAGQITVAGGTNINTAGAGQTVTVNLDDTVTISGKLTASDLKATNLGTGFLESDAAGDITNSEGTDGQVIIGATGGPAAWANLTSTSGSILYTTGANTLNLESAAGLGSPFVLVESPYDTSPGGSGVDVSYHSSDIFVICGTNKIITSATSDSWVLRHTLSAGTFVAVHCGSNGTNVACTDASVAAKVIVSTNPVGAWTEYAVNAASVPSLLTDIAFDGTYWLLTGLTPAAPVSATYWATDPTAEAWTVNTSGLPANANEYANEAAFGGGVWVIVGQRGLVAYQNTDPTGSWTDITATAGFLDLVSPTNFNVNSVAWSSTLSLFCAVGDKGKIATSPDGVTWTHRVNTFDFSAKISSVVWDSTNSMFYSVATVVEVRMSSFSYNGTTWFPDYKGVQDGSTTETKSAVGGGNIITVNNTAGSFLTTLPPA